MTRYVFNYIPKGTEFNVLLETIATPEPYIKNRVNTTKIVTLEPKEVESIVIEAETYEEASEKYKLLNKKG